MFVTKSEPILTTNGKIKSFMEIKNGILIINDKYKFQDGKWFFYGDDSIWYYLGLGANPNIEDDGNDITNQELYNNIFEEISEEQL